MEQRIEPALPVQAMKTYGLRAPLATHFREATCEEVGCEPYRRGWVTWLDSIAQSDLIQTVRNSGRKPSAVLHEDGRIGFVFEAGTRCFKAHLHRLPLDREPLYVVRAGDWRGNPTGEQRVHVRGTDWVEDMQESLEQTRRRQERG